MDIQDLGDHSTQVQLNSKEMTTLWPTTLAQVELISIHAYNCLYIIQSYARLVQNYQISIAIGSGQIKLKAIQQLLN